MSRLRKLPQEQLLLQKDTKNNSCGSSAVQKVLYGTGFLPVPFFLSAERGVFPLRPHNVCPEAAFGLFKACNMQLYTAGRLIFLFLCIYICDIVLYCGSHTEIRISI